MKIYFYNSKINKLKNIITILFFISISSITYSQNNNKPTRQQTESWLIEKINKYILKETFFSFDVLEKKISGHKNNFKIELNNENITITCVVTKYISNRFFSDGLEIEKKEYLESTTIPLNKITNKAFIKKSYLVFESNYNSFIFKSDNIEQSPTNWFGIQILDNNEENFAERFNKAMNYLLSFIKTNKATEIF